MTRAAAFGAIAVPSRSRHDLSPEGAADGGVVLPADVRKRLDLLRGGDLIVEETPDGLVLRTLAQAVARAQAMARRLLADRPDVKADSGE